VTVSGAFVVAEGPDGAGKSSLVRALGARLLADGMQVLQVREPGGTPVAEAARKVALRSRHEISPAAELFLILAARADLVARVIRPALEAGQIVLADRFDLSTRAYQVAGRGLLEDDVDAALRLATGGLVPDLTLVLDIPVEIGRERQRRARKVQDRFEREDDAFHERVRGAYRAAAGPGVVHFDGTSPKPTLLEAVWREIQTLTAFSTRGVS
jgi:dTMP kinase